MNKRKTMVRASVVFVALISLFLSTFSSAVYAGWRSGEIEEKIIRPIKEKISTVSEAIASSFEEKEPIEKAPEPVSKEELFKDFEKEEKKSLPVKTVNQQAVPVYQYKNSLPKSQSPAPSLNNDNFSTDYEEARKQQEEWWQKAQADQKKFAEESQKRMEEFKKQGQQNMENFRNTSDQNVQDFWEKYNFPELMR